MTPSIQFFSEGISFRLDNKTKIRSWFLNCADDHNYKIDYINYIFCNDEYLLQINQTSLNHDYYTDIITFDLSSSEKIIEADIFISLDRIRDNAKKLSVDFINELHRVMIHGLLHLVGYDDRSKEDALVMRQKESVYLSLLKN